MRTQWKSPSRVLQTNNYQSDGSSIPSQVGGPPVGGSEPRHKQWLRRRVPKEEDRSDISNWISLEVKQCVDERRQSGDRLCKGSATRSFSDLTNRNPGDSGHPQNLITAAVRHGYSFKPRGYSSIVELLKSSVLTHRPHPDYTKKQASNELESFARKRRPKRGRSPRSDLVTELSASGIGRRDVRSGAFLQIAKQAPRDGSRA